MKNKQISLAIVIPFYKISYFEELLVALNGQTVSKFNIYIGDDCSPNAPDKIIKKYENSLNITYKRFEKNLGATDLVAQWHKCLGMVKGEEWVWILPDDDVPSSNVVEEFYDALKLKNKYSIKVFRFPVSVIDKKGNIVNCSDYNDPLIETNLNFYQRVVRGMTTAYLGDNIFHKASLLQNGGFVNFPKAWASDHATILQVSAKGTIYFLSKARLHFRMSGENISSDKTDGVVKLEARIEFAKWLKKNEIIFPNKPTVDFYQYFYWKTEHCVLHEYLFSIKLFYELYRLRSICFNSWSIIPVMLIFYKKFKAIIAEKIGFH